MSISRLPGPFGAEICSFGPMALSAADRDELNQALGDRAVLAARGLHLSPAQHVELTRAFGVPDIHPIESIRLAGCSRLSS
jgi:alpha-ketoglutarate-dependent taurine dioxygenase